MTSDQRADFEAATRRHVYGILPVPAECGHEICDSMGFYRFCRCGARSIFNTSPYPPETYFTWGPWLLPVSGAGPTWGGGPAAELLRIQLDAKAVADAPRYFRAQYENEPLKEPEKQ